MKHIVDALNEGDKRGLMDACFVNLPGVPDHASEYDGGFYHGEQRIPNDIVKTQKMLKHDDLLVCRVRVGTPMLPMEDKRLIMVYTQNPAGAVDAMRTHFIQHVTDTTIRTRLMSSYKRDSNVYKIVHDLFMWGHTEYKSQFESLANHFGTNTAQMLLNVHGIKSRLASGTVVRILDRLVAAPYHIKKLETFMCGGVAARFGDEEGLFRILDRLVAAPYHIKKLETFMCNGVAARFGDEDFLLALTTMPHLNKASAVRLCRSYPLAKRARISC